MANLSVVIATYNEEKNIGKCLEAVIDLASEIVVVDGGSKDKTTEIARRIGARIISSDNPPMFHLNKQKGLEEARFPWILQLDADEIVSYELKEEIREIIKSDKNKEINGYFLPRLNFFLGKPLRKGGVYPDPVLRLVRRGQAKFLCKSVHEQMEVKGQTASLTHDLIHRPYPTFQDYLVKADRYTDLTADEYQKNKIPINPVSFLNYLIVKPFIIFGSIYMRHLGVLDGFPGLVWAFFSALHPTIAYLKYLKRK